MKKKRISAIRVHNIYEQNTPIDTICSGAPSPFLDGFYLK